MNTNEKNKELITGDLVVLYTFYFPCTLLKQSTLWFTNYKTKKSNDSIVYHDNQCPWSGRPQSLHEKTMYTCLEQNWPSRQRALDWCGCQNTGRRLHRGTKKDTKEEQKSKKGVVCKDIISSVYPEWAMAQRFIKTHKVLFCYGEIKVKLWLLNNKIIHYYWIIHYFFESHLLLFLDKILRIDTAIQLAYWPIEI